MKRTDAAGATLTNMFTNGDPQGGVPATVVDDTWLNQVQEEICNVIELAGITLDDGQDDQLYDAILALIAANATTPDASETVKGKVELATTAEAATGTDTVRAVTPAGLAAYAPYATGAEVKTGTSSTKIPRVNTLVQHQGVCKAWCRFVGTGTPAITNSYNCSSITDNGAGDFTINFTTAFANANYTLAGCASWSAAANPIVTQPNATAPATGSCRINTVEASSAGLFDANRAYVIFFGEQ